VCALANTLFIAKDGSALPSAIQAVLRREGKRIARDYPRLRDPAIIQDILDGVGQAVLDKVERAEPITSLAHFVSVLAKRAAIRRLRGVDIFERYEARPLVENGATPPRTPPELLIPSDLLDAMDEMLIMAHIFEGRGHRETATVLGMSESTARKRYSRAIEKLRAVMQSQLPVGPPARPGRRRAKKSENR
jgi:DNA-directed RNA polymerase specialized sigma24 family protein